MRIVPGNARSAGARESQQDEFGFSDMEDRAFTAHGGVLAVVADGMGGLAMGREAARTAKTAMIREYEAKPPQEDVPRALHHALRQANAAVFEMARRAGIEEGKTGSTLAAAVVRGENLYWASVGDSRIYLRRRGRLARLTEDHVYGLELAMEVAAGTLSREEAETHPQRGQVVSFLGLRSLGRVDRSVKPFPLQPGDRILLCSDGLYNALSDEEMAELSGGPPQEACEALVRGTLSKGLKNQDNVTVAMLACEADPAPATKASPSGGRPRGRGRRATAALLFAILCGAGVFFYAKTWHVGTNAPAPGGNAAMPADNETGQQPPEPAEENPPESRADDPALKDHLESPTTDNGSPEAVDSEMPDNETSHEDAKPQDEAASEGPPDNATGVGPQETPDGDNATGPMEVERSEPPAHSRRVPSSGVVEGSISFSHPGDTGLDKTPSGNRTTTQNEEARKQEERNFP